MKERCQEIFDLFKSDDYFDNVRDLGTRRPMAWDAGTEPEIYWGFSAEVNRKVYDYDEEISVSCKPLGIGVELSARWSDLFVDEKYTDRLARSVDELGDPMISYDAQEMLDDVRYDDCVEDAEEECSEQGLKGDDYYECIEEAKEGCEEDAKEWWVEVGGHTENEYGYEHSNELITQDIKRQMDSFFRGVDKLIELQRIE